MGACFIYARQSDPYGGAKNEGDDALSLDAQLSVCRQHAAKLGLHVIGEYQEQFSGLSEQRPQYLKMLADIKANGKAHKKDDPARVTTVVIYKWSRLSRDPATIVYLNNQFRKQGIAIEPAADHQVGNSQYDELLVYTIATFNRIQVQDAIDFSTNARKTLLDNGKLVCNGRARYGYKYDKEKRVRIIDEEKAEVVRLIFNWFCEGHSAHTTMNLLKQRGIKSPSGKPRWGLKSIRDIVKDPSYKGAPMRVQKTERIPIDEGGTYHPCGSRKARPTQGREVGGATPSIVTEEVWDKANELVKGRHRAMVKSGDWLVGRVWCESCKVRLGRHLHHNRKYWYFRCPNHRQFKECKIKLGHALDDYIRGLAEQSMIKFLSDPKIREAKLQAMQESLAEPRYLEEYEQAQAEIVKLKEKVKSLFRRFGDDPELETLLEGEVRSTQREIKRQEKLCEEFGVRASQARLAAETANQVRDWLLAWSTHWLTKSCAGTLPQQLVFQDELTNEDKALAAEAAGLKIVIGRPEDPTAGKIQVDVYVFDYKSTSIYPPPKPPEDGGQGGWDWDEERDGPYPSGRGGRAERRAPSRGRNREPPAGPSSLTA